MVLAAPYLTLSRIELGLGDLVSQKCVGIWGIAFGETSFTGHMQVNLFELHQTLAQTSVIHGIF